MIFSDLPQINIDRCVRNSIKFFRSTPKSISRRNLWDLDLLKQYPRLPRIDIEDLILLRKNSQTSTMMLNTDDGNTFCLEDQRNKHQCCDCLKKSSFLIIDCRPKEKSIEWGFFVNSLKYDDFITTIASNNLNNPIANSRGVVDSTSSQQKSFPQNHSLIVVVNSTDKALELIENYAIPHLCLLEHHQIVPKALRLILKES